VKAFLSHSILLEKLGYARRNSKMIELSQEKFSEFFAVMEILGQESSSGDRHHRKAKAKVNETFI
jgi:hypothetical protein